MKKYISILSCLVVTLIILSACSSSTNSEIESDNHTNEKSEHVVQEKELITDKTKSESVVEEDQSVVIYLYGEAHGNAKLYDMEFEIWQDYYTNQNMRHLFIEAPYFTAEYLNLWMKSDNDEILEDLYNDWAGTSIHVPSVKDYYKKIKENCPETIFHGTDVGHCYNETGTRYLQYLKNNNKENTEEYRLTEEAIEQGKEFYKNFDDAYRENMMVENFVREYDKLIDESIMGIYGNSHTKLDAMNYSGEVPSMGKQLSEFYSNITNEDISKWADN